MLSEMKAIMSPSSHISLVNDTRWKQLFFYMKMGSLTKAITGSDEYPFAATKERESICYNGSQIY